MKSSRIRSFAAIMAMACSLVVSVESRAGDPGELFPNIAPYDETVSSPISKPDVKKTTPTPTPTPTAPEPPKVDPVQPTPPPVKPADPDTVTNPNPPQDPNTGRPFNNKKKKGPMGGPGTQPATQPAGPPPPPLVEYVPYAELVMRPMVSSDDSNAFETGFADPITKALASTPEQRKKTADLLESSAQSVTSPELKRYLLLHAFGLYIRAAIPANEREQKAQALLPLLTDKTLPVMQARADALNDLYQTFTSNANNAFLDLYIDAHATLTKYRVQAGFPKEAQDALKKTRDAGIHYVKKPQARTDEINEAAAWSDRANAASKLAPTYQAALKANPDDPAANTMMATLHISLYGNLEHAMPFAAKSDRKDMKQLATVLAENPPRDLSKDPVKHAEQVLAIGEALVDVAKATSVSQLFDRYSIACFAGDHVAQVIDNGAMPAPKVLEAKTMLANAKDVVDKTYLKRGDDLPKWLGGTGGTGTANPTTTAVVKHTVSSVGDLLKGLPKELAPLDTGWTQGQMNQVNDWLAKTHDKQGFDAQVFVERMDNPVDGADGKVYVPVMFEFQNVQLKDALWLKTYVEVRMSPAMAARAKDLAYGAQVQIKGTIQSTMMRNYSTFPGEAKIVSLHIVVLNKE